MAAGSARISLGFSCLGHAYMHVFTAIYFVIVLALEADWGLPYHQLIELWALASLLVGLGALPAGWIADRWSATGMMVVYFLGLGAAGILCGLVDSTLAMFLGLTSIGLFSSIYHPVGIAWLVRNAASRGLVLGINGVFGSIGIASAGLLAGGLIDLFGWRAAFIVPGVVSLVTGLALIVCLRLGLVVEGGRDRNPDPPPSRGDMVRVFAILLVTMFLMGLVFQATQAALPKVFDLRLRDIAGDGAFGIGVMVAIVYTAGGLMQLAGGYLADRWPLKPLYIASWLFQIPVYAAIAAASGLPLIAVSILAVLLGAGALPAENMLLARYTPEHHRSLAFGVKYVLAFGSGPFAIWLVALVNELTGEFVWLFALLALMATAGTAAALWLPGQWRRPAPAAAE
jgi:MFS family permease